MDNLINFARRFKGFLAFAALIFLGLIFLANYFFSKGSFDKLLAGFGNLSADQFLSVVYVALGLPFMIVLLLIILSFISTARENKQGKKPQSGLIYVIVHDAADKTKGIPDAEVRLMLPEPKTVYTDINGGAKFIFPAECGDYIFPINASKAEYQSRKEQQVKITHGITVYIALKRDVQQPRQPDQKKSPKRTSTTYVERQEETSSDKAVIKQEIENNQTSLSNSLLFNSEIIGQFYLTRERVVVHVHQKYEPIYSDDISTAFNELNRRKHNKGLEGYYSGQRFRPITPPRVSTNSVELDLTPINYAFVALMKDEEVDVATKQRVQDRIIQSANIIPKSLLSDNHIFNPASYNLLGIEVCLITSDGMTLLRRRGTSVLTGRHRWDVSVSGHPLPDDLRGDILDIARTVQRETEQEIGIVNGDPRKIVFIGLHCNKICGDIDLLALWPIENSVEQLKELITERHPNKRTKIFKTTKKARESYVWDTDNLLVEFSGPAIVKAFSEESITIESLLPESLICLELALIAQNRPSLDILT